VRTDGGSAGLAAVVFALAAGAVAAALGLVPGVLTTRGTIALGVLGLLALAGLLLRRGLRAKPERSALPLDESGGGAPATVSSETVPRSDQVLRIPRFLFYMGALTSAQASLRPVLGLTVSELFFIAAFGATILAALAGRSFSRVQSGLVIGVGVFAFGGLISSAGAVSHAGSVSEVLHGVYVMLLWVWTGATVLRTREHIVIALALWTISVAIDGSAAILQALGVSALGGPLENGRALGLTDHPNDLGAASAIALVPALMLATSRFPGEVGTLGALMRPTRWVVVALIAAGLMLSASVGAFVAGLVAILVWLVAPAVRVPGRMAVITILAFALLAAGLAGGRVTSPTQRLHEVTSAQGTQATSGSGEIRVKIAKRALHFIEEDPIVGKGLDASGKTVEMLNQGRSGLYQVHGAPVALWYEAGIFGLLGVLMVVVTLIRGAWRSLTTRHRDDLDLVIGLAIFAAFIAYLIIALISPFSFQEYGWIAAVMLFAWQVRCGAAAPILVPAAISAAREGGEIAVGGPALRAPATGLVTHGRRGATSA
jgi:hypothetical protein